MRRIQLPPPVGSRTMPGVVMPDDMPAHVGTAIFRAAYGAPAAYLALGRAVRSPAGLVYRTWQRRVEAWGTAEWESVAARDASDLARLSLVRRTGDLDGLDSLIAPPVGSAARVEQWVAWLMGHQLGRHSEGCAACGAAVRQDWERLVDVTGTPPALIADLFRALEAAGLLARRPASPKAEVIF